MPLWHTKKLVQFTPDISTLNSNVENLPLLSAFLRYANTASVYVQSTVSTDNSLQTKVTLARCVSSRQHRILEE